jgi:hypothetical protein
LTLAFEPVALRLLLVTRKVDAWPVILSVLLLNGASTRPKTTPKTRPPSRTNLPAKNSWGAGRDFLMPAP